MDTGSAHALENLGYTRDGAQIRSDAYMLDVPSDDAGGESGPPADVQHLGEVMHIIMDLTKWDATILAKVTPRKYGGTAGTPGTPGSLLIGGGLTYRLIVYTAVTPLNFPCVIFREPYEFNRGTKFSTMRLEGTAYKNGSGLLYNNDTTGVS